MLQYDLDLRSGGSLYEELVRRMRADIASGIISPDEHLPSKRDFARVLGVSVITVEHAYQQLVAEGYVRAIQRKGYFANDVASFAARFTEQNTFYRQGLKNSSLQGGAGEHQAWSKQTSNVFLANTAASSSFELSISGGKHNSHKQSEIAFRLTGGVAPDSFPRRVWSRIVREVIEDTPGELLLQSSPFGGIPELKCAIADYIARSRDMMVSSEQVIIGAGAQALYPLIARLFKGSQFAVEDPGYPALARTYESNGIKVCRVAATSAGVDMDALRASKAALVHVMPSHHFPTGAVMPIARRYELLAWASEHKGRYIVEDDYDCEFRHFGRPIPALQSIDADERVIYLNTFTRTIAPSLRLGYMVLPFHLLERFKRDFKDEASSVSVIEQLALARFINEGHFDKHINKMRRHYREVQQACLSVFEATDYEVIGKDAGLHFVLNTKKSLDENCLLQALEQKGIQVKTMAQYCFGTQNDKFGKTAAKGKASKACGAGTSGHVQQQGSSAQMESLTLKAKESCYLVICYSGLSKEDAHEAMLRVCDVLDSF